MIINRRNGVVAERIGNGGNHIWVLIYEGSFLSKKNLDPCSHNQYKGNDWLGGIKVSSFHWRRRSWIWESVFEDVRMESLSKRPPLSCQYGGRFELTFPQLTSAGKRSWFEKEEVRALPRKQEIPGFDSETQNAKPSKPFHWALVAVFIVDFSWPWHEDESGHSTMQFAENLWVLLVNPVDGKKSQTATWDVNPVNNGI